MKEIGSGEECAGIQESAIFLCLPPYSPGLDPVEQAWRIARRERTRDRLFRALSDLAEAVEGSLCRMACA